VFDDLDATLQALADSEAPRHCAARWLTHARKLGREVQIVWPAGTVRE
jgi:hypothetical protein